MAFYNLSACGKSPNNVGIALDPMALMQMVKPYYATVHITVAKTDCGSVSRVALAYHPDDERDPEATMPFKDTDGDIVAYLYPTRSDAHPVAVLDHKGDVIGYGMSTAYNPIVSANAKTLQEMHDLAGKLLGYNTQP
jgi:hypothetical protein|nr:MAG TPA: hypothetical protein [Caudoviricetes sp.]